MRLNIGAGGRLLPGFDSVDVRNVPEARRGHAADLSFARDGSVETIFSNAVLEHLFIGQHLAAVREWRRVLQPDNGCAVILGIPDFERIAELYLARRPGILSERFDLYHVYRYTHGDAESAADVAWSRWNPADRPDSAPTGYLPQLHKAPLDAGYVAGLFDRAALPAVLFNYSYPGESYPLNIGVVAGSVALEDALARIPGLDEYLQVDTIQIRDVAVADDGLLALAEGLDAQAATGTRSRIKAAARRRLRP